MSLNWRIEEMNGQPHKFAAGDKLIDIKEVINMVRLSRTRIYEMCKLDLFPRPVKVGQQRVAWIEAEIVNYINERISDRDKLKNHERTKT